MLWLMASTGFTLFGCPQDSPASAPSTAPTETSKAPGQNPEKSPEKSEVPTRVAIRHIVLAYHGAQGAPLGTNRTREEAQEAAQSLRERILAGEEMAELAKRYSSDGTRARGGFLGSSEPGGWVAEFEQAAFALNVGDLSDVVETAFGFHVIRREALQEVRLRHMVVQYHGAANLSGRAREEKRTRDQAQATSLLALAAIEEGQDFEAVAREYSDGPMGQRGADLGWFTRGEIGPAFDEAVFLLEPGEISGIIESPFGFHIVERVE